MIRLRFDDGRTEEVADSVAVVELCSADGQVAAIVIQDAGRLIFHEEGDPEFDMYCAGLGLEKARRITMGDPK